MEDLNNNKKFMKKYKTFCSDKELESSNSIIKGKEELITDNSTLASLFNNYFIKITSTLKQSSL